MNLYSLEDPEILAPASKPISLITTDFFASIIALMIGSCSLLANSLYKFTLMQKHLISFRGLSLRRPTASEFIVLNRQLFKDLHLFTCPISKTW